MRMLGFLKYCVCGKPCTSKPGLTLHQRCCKKAQAANKKKILNTLDVQMEPKIQYIDQINEFVNLAELIAYDAHHAIKDKNKSAGQRARVRMLLLKKMIIPLRKEILKRIGSI